MEARIAGGGTRHPCRLIRASLFASRRHLTPLSCITTHHRRAPQPVSGHVGEPDPLVQGEAHCRELTAAFRRFEPALMPRRFLRLRARAPTPTPPAPPSPPPPPADQVRRDRRQGALQERGRDPQRPRQLPRLRADHQGPCEVQGDVQALHRGPGRLLGRHRVGVSLGEEGAGALGRVGGGVVRGKGRRMFMGFALLHARSRMQAACSCHRMLQARARMHALPSSPCSRMRRARPRPHSGRTSTRRGTLTCARAPSSSSGSRAARPTSATTRWTGAS